MIKSPTVSASLGWTGILRVGLAQAALGSIVVLVTSTLNRIWVVEYSVPALVPALLVALHYGVQLVRPRFGHRSDLGKRRTPWVVGGLLVLIAGALLCASSTLWLHDNPSLAIAIAAGGYVLVGLGVGAAGTSLLALLASGVDAPRRAAAATLMWCLMIAGFAVASIVVGHFLDPFTPQKLVKAVAATSLVAYSLALVSLWGVEPAPESPHAPRTLPSPGASAFGATLARVWNDPASRRFTLFVFMSMLAYSAQELLLEPFAGLVFGYSPGNSAQLSGLWHSCVFVGMLAVGIACSGARRVATLETWTLGGCLASAAALLSLALAGVASPAWSLRVSVIALGLGNGVFAVAAIGSMMARAHRGTLGAGMLMGVWGAAQALAFGVGGLSATLIVDVVRHMGGSPAAAFALVFTLEAALFCVAARFIGATSASLEGASQGASTETLQGAATETFDAVVVGGGPSGATAATDLVRRGFTVCLLDRAGRIKPCGGAIPPKVIEEFDVPESLLVARINSARMVSPTSATVDMPIDGGYVGMVDREVFDEWLRNRARSAGCDLRTAEFERVARDQDGMALVFCRGQSAPLRARVVIGADGAMSNVARQCIAGAHRIRYVAAYHEIIRVSPALPGSYSATRCDVYYQGKLSPDFYAWIFPHGDTASIGVGSARKGFSLRRAVTDLRSSLQLDAAQTIRREGAPIPMKPLRRWDNGRDVVLAGDAAGVVAPASGEGIYYAMAGGRYAALAATQFLQTGDARCLKNARRDFMRAHGLVFLVLGVMQRFWYSTDKRRERFVSICADEDVQRLTWQAYMYKKLVRAKPLAHIRIFFKDMAHLLGLVRA